MFEDSMNWLWDKWDKWIVTSPLHWEDVALFQPLQHAVYQPLKEQKRLPTLDPTGPTKLAKRQCTFFPISPQCCKRLENLTFLHEMDHFWLSIVQPVEMHWETVDYPKFNGWTMGRLEKYREILVGGLELVFFHFRYGMSSFPLTNSINFSRWLYKTTNQFISFQLTFHIQP